eukprot:3688385-Pyramimonas_sp.AAC.1
MAARQDQPTQHGGVPRTAVPVYQRPQQHGGMLMTAVPGHQSQHGGAPMARTMTMTAVPGHQSQHGGTPMTRTMTAIPDHSVIDDDGFCHDPAADDSTVISMRSGGVGMLMGGDGRVTMRMDVAKPGGPRPTPTAAEAPKAGQRFVATPRTPPHFRFIGPDGGPRPPAGPPPLEFMSSSPCNSKAAPQQMLPPEAVPTAQRF